MSNNEQVSKTSSHDRWSHQRSDHRSERRPDRRVSRTRRALREAILALILEKGYDAVTVEEITDRADLGRTTFYLHYRDKEELLLESIHEIVEDLLETINGIPLSAWRVETGSKTGELSPLSPVRLAFQHAASNADLYRIMLRGEGGIKTVERMREIINKAVEEFMFIKGPQENLTIEPAIPMEVFSNYFAGALLGIITWWLERDMPYGPDQMAEMFQHLFFRGAGQMLDLRPGAQSRKAE